MDVEVGEKGGHVIFVATIANENAQPITEPVFHVEVLAFVAWAAAQAEHFDAGPAFIANNDFVHDGNIAN